MAIRQTIFRFLFDTGDSKAKLDEAAEGTEKLNENLKETSKEAKKAEKDLDKATDAVGRMPGPVGAAVDGIKGMVNSFKAIIASPVGMILAGVAVAVGALVAVFQNFSPVVDFISDKIALVTGAFRGLQSQVYSFINGTGFSTEKIKEQALAMQEVEQMTRDYDDNLSALNLTQSKYERQIDVNLKKLKNKNITEKESNAIIEETIRLQKLQIEGLQENQKEETEILKKKVIAEGGTYAQILAIAKGAQVTELNTGNETLDAALIALQNNYQKREDAVSTYEQKYERIQNVRDAQEIKFNTKRENERKAAEEQRKKEAEQAAKLLELNEKQQKEREEAVKTGFDKTSKLTEEYYKKQTTDILNQNLTTEQSKKALDELELKRLNQQIENAKMYAQSTVDLELQLAQKKANIIKDAADAQKKTDEDLLKKKKEDAETQKKLDEEVSSNKVKALESYSTSLKAFASVLGESTAEGKTLAVAAATIDTYLAAQKAYTSQLNPLDPTSPFRGALAAAAAIAVGVANVKKILDVQVPGGGGSGGSVPSAPPMTRPSSSFTRIDNTNPIDVNNTGSTKVYVTETDITETQNKVDAIKAKAVIG